MPVGYLEDVLLYHDFATAWDRFSKAEGEEKDKLVKEHPMFELCMEIWFEQQGERLKANRKKRGKKKT